MSVTTSDSISFPQNTEVDSLETAMQYAAAQGIKLSASDYRQISELQRLQDELDTLPTAGQSWLTLAMDTFNRQYPNFLKFLHRAGDVIITLMQTLIVAIGNPAILLLLLWVEHARVVYGLNLFEASHRLAWLGAWAIVLLNLTLEFTVHYVEHRAGYVASRATRFSLRSWWADLRYLLGIGRDWKPLQLSPAQQYRNLSKIVTMTILILALAGSMKGAIEKVSAPDATGQAAHWYNALWAILADSTLLEMATWASGLVFALAAILGVQKTASYIAIRCAEIVSHSERQAQRGKNEAPAIQYIMAKVSERQSRAAAAPITPIAYNASEVSASPFLAVMKAPNGNGNGHH